MPGKPTVTVLHALPGRIRLAASQRLVDSERVRASVLGHDGLTEFAYTSITRSVLVRYDPAVIAQEEVVLRLALAVSLDAGGHPVRVLYKQDIPVAAPMAFYSGFLLTVSGLSRLFGMTPLIRMRMDWFAGLGVAGAVVDHAWREMHDRGNFDPEVLSLAYLATAFIRGNFLTAAAVTWFTTFGRHLIDMPRTGVELRPVQTENGEEDRFELVAAPDFDAPDRTRLLTMLQGMLKYVLTGGVAPESNLLDQLREVSRVHGEVVDGLGWMRHGIPMRFE